MKKMLRSFISVAVILACLPSCNNSHKADQTSRIELLARDTALATSYVNRLMTEEEYGTCRNFLDTLIHFDPTNGRYFFTRAYCNSELGYPSKAQYDWERSIALGFHVADSYFNLALHYAALKKDSLSKTYALKCLAIDSNHQEAKELLEVYSKFSSSATGGSLVDASPKE